VLSVVILLLTGLGSSIYLTHLHFVVHGGGTGEVQSFCAISEGFNCVTVATSEYSVFLGIPVAVWGLEFFALALLVVGLSGLGIWSVRRWDSLLFIAMTLSLPVCAALAWISVSCINSVCIMCCAIYGVNLTTFVVLLAANRAQLRRLVTAGPRELLRLSGKGIFLLLLVVALGISQLFWLPPLIATEKKPIKAGTTQAWHGLPTRGLTIGPPDAPIQLEEFTDFECPFCGKAHEVMMQVIQQFPGKIHLRHRDYPLDMACHPRIPRPVHPHACQAAYYARCAARQEKYWPFEALLFKNRERLERSHLEEYAREVGLDPVELKRCVRNEATFQAVRADIELGLQRKIEGTPTVFINGNEAVVGLRPADWWAQKIGAILQGK
jgi:protein-disulfide isomerase/uncharacterized membrane protein